MTPYLQDADVTLYCGDALAVLRELEAESVDCCVTSPPYWGLRDYGTPGQLGLEPTPELYVERMVEVFREVRRVLASHGTVWLNLGDSYAHSLRQSGAAHAGDKQNTNAGSMRHGFKPLPGGLKEKDLVGAPWRVAFALQADGWYLRSDIIWAKPNPMPESVTDRPTKTHEYVFLLSKQPRYFFDQEAVREPHSPDGRTKTVHDHLTDRSHPNYDNVGNGNERWPNGGRNIRSVWEIATQPYPEAHFATFPEELARRCIAAGCPEQVCRVCGKARERVVERGRIDSRPGINVKLSQITGGNAAQTGRAGEYAVTVTGYTDCECPAPVGVSPSTSARVAPQVTTGGPGAGKYCPGIVLDPFVGSGTTCFVARKLGRRSVGIDLSAEYLELAARRLQQQSLFAVEA